MRVSPFPTECQLVFTSVHHPLYAQALAETNPDSIMSSFEYIRKDPAKFHQTFIPVFDSWPVRRYLDSGLFTLMRQTGTSHIKKGYARQRLATTPREALKQLTYEYRAYLIAHQDDWDHIADLDCDAIEGLGPILAAGLRRMLREIVGDKLMPVWHPEAGLDTWYSMVGNYPYVAIGSGMYGPGHDPSLGELHYVRKLVRDAHAVGSLVHLMGTVREVALVETEADSGDSSSWESGPLVYARFGGQLFTRRRNLSPTDLARWRSFAAHMQQTHDVDPETLLKKGLNLDKLRLGIAAQMESEARIRAKRKELAQVTHG